METPKRVMHIETRDEAYRSLDGWTLARETGPHPLGPDYGALDGVWVLRDGTGSYLYNDRYRNDIADRFNLELEH